MERAPGRDCSFARDLRCSTLVEAEHALERFAERWDTK
jgi:hypothetical protein